MKKLSIICLIMAFAFLFVGCENSTQLQAAYFSEITGAGSENYGVTVSFADEKRLDGKGTDVQVKFEKTGVVTIWMDGTDKIEYTIEENDEWYSLTHIFAAQGNKDGIVSPDKFERYEEVVGKTYLFNSKEKMTITMRVVVGDVEKNSEENGEILVGSMPVSQQFKLKIK